MLLLNDGHLLTLLASRQLCFEEAVAATCVIGFIA
jgi:hypothetical protein